MSQQPRPPGLDDPEYAAFAWRRFRRMLLWVLLAAILTVAVALAALAWAGVPLTVHVILATAIGGGLSVMCAGLLMGLVFLSSGTGHDEEVDRRR